MDYRKLLKQPLPASLFRRGVAYVIDMALVSLLILMPLQPTIDTLSGGDSVFAAYKVFQSNPQLVFKLFLLSLVIALLTIFYWAILEYKLWQSVGKLLCSIHVSSTTKQLTFGQCFLRNITKFTTLFLLLDLVYMLFKGGHQRYTEVVSKTEVLLGGVHGQV